MMKNTFKLELNFGDVQKEIDKTEKKKRAKATKHVAKVLKQNASSKFGTDSNITKGIGHINEKFESKVGVGPPAYHAHLVEFGTDSRYTKGGKPTGYIKADPFMIPTFEEEAAAVERILYEEWI